jgi:hypothetical protein
MGIAVLRKVLVKAGFDVKPTSSVGGVFQPEFEGNILSLESNLKSLFHIIAVKHTSFYI